MSDRINKALVGYWTALSDSIRAKADATAANAAAWSGEEHMRQALVLRSEKEHIEADRAMDVANAIEKELM